MTEASTPTALGRITAHEFGHILLGSGHDSGEDLMGEHTFADTYDPKYGQDAFGLQDGKNGTKNQRAALLKACKALVKRRTGGGGGSNDGNAGPDPSERPSIGPLPDVPGPALD
jgi:hypothetical protein